MENKYIPLIIFVVISSIGFSQNAILCPKIGDIIAIDDLSDVPIVTDNDDGTITLNHPEQYITDIFANHVIYDFFQTFPNVSGVLEQYYTILYQDKELILDLKMSVPEEIFFIESDYPYSPISPNLIDFLDEKVFRLTHYCSIADNFGEPCPEEEVPEGVNISVTFNYDATTDMISMESFGLTECGNSFSIGLRGGVQPNSLQLWKSFPGVITETDYESDACHVIEEHLYSMLDIACYGMNIGDIMPTINSNDNTLFLYRSNMVFGYHNATFIQENLAVSEAPFEDLKIYQLEGNPYLQISNMDGQFYIEISSVTGSQILDKVLFEKNQILIDNYSNGLYFIKISDGNENYKVFKFLNR